MGKLPIVLGALVLGVAVAPAALAQDTPYGALAVDEVQGYHFGFAHDHGNQVDADRRATEECQKAGGTSCRVVLLWSGAGCGAYRSVTEDGYAYGWGVAGTRAAAETIAERELMARSNGRMAQNQAWACNSATPAPLAVLLEQAPPQAGPMRFPDKEGDEFEYQGALQGGVPHGHGVATFPDGMRYEGSFVNGAFHGYGVYTWPSGARYEGEFQHWEMHGQGTYRFASGKTYVGDLRNSKLEGYGKYYDTSGNLVYDGRWSNNRQVD